MNYQNMNQHVRVKLGARLDLGSIQQQKDILKKVLAFKKPIVFSSDEVNAIDTASFQLLLCFTQAAVKENINWEWQEPSSHIIKIAKLLGMREILKLPEG